MVTSPLLSTPVAFALTDTPSVESFVPDKYTLIQLPLATADLTVDAGESPPMVTFCAMA
jgi:hypothetical protein